MPIKISQYFPELITLTPTISLNLVSNKKFSQVPREQSEFFCFGLSGCFKGSFVCCCTEKLDNNTKGILLEAFNIVIGRTIGAIEDETGLLLDLEAPTIETKAPIDVSARNEVSYNLNINDKTYKCSLFSDLQQQIDLKLRTAPVVHGKEGVSNA